MHRVFIVDDSKTARLALRGMLAREPETFSVVGEASSADEARERVVSLAPDLVTLDVELGRDDGVRLCAEIHGLVRTRIVIVTGVSPRDPELLFRSLTSGALDVLAKPSGADTPLAASEQARFVRALRALARVPLLRSWRATTTPVPPSSARSGTPDAAGLDGTFDRILVGVSTGGPPLLESMLSRVPSPLPVPLVIVQHIAVGFGEGFARWLGGATGHDVRYASTASTLAPGVVYVASDVAHAHLVGPTHLRIGPSKRTRSATPSVDELFESAVAHAPERTLAILLTGMGSDGAAGLAALRSAGATTIAQTPRTCVVGSMPESAIALGGAMYVLDPDAIVGALRDLGARGASGIEPRDGSVARRDTTVAAEAKRP